MISANELMIGDWVKFPIGNDKVVDLPYIEGRGICASFAASATLFPVEIDKIEPIPITPEILEKNGFIVRTAYTVPKWHIGLYGRDDSDITLNIYSEKKQEWRLSIETNRNERTVCYINNIHELQHALRLCGITLNIEV